MTMPMAMATRPKRSTRSRSVTPLWMARELSEATGGTFSLPFDATGVSIDTRTLEPGDLFVALVGEGRDGHAFVEQAFAKGAAGAMVQVTAGRQAPLLVVDDTLAALARLGGYARARTAAQVVAVTGSVGKTTTKEMLRTILASQGATHAAVASYNNHWGLPLTLARLPRDAAYCVAEIGMNHAGEIAPLARLAHPHVAVITAIERAHIGYLGSIEAIADEKVSIVQGLDPDGTIVLPRDSALFPRLRQAAGKRPIATFGADPASDIRLIDIEATADGSTVLAEAASLEIRFRLPAPGRHMVLNALAALAATKALGLPLTAATRALEGFAPIVGRGARKPLPLPGGGALLLDESYNGNGASMRAALEVLRLQPGRRRIAVLGDMLELGEAGPAEHEALAADVARSSDLLFACGPLMRHLFDAVPPDHRAVHEEDSASLAPAVAAAIAPGDAILVKGSLGSRMKTIVQAIEARSIPIEKQAGSV
jgi:UDP-N-acetylmuramoyl-tripeptide--D-alanyl-D-alanine ligase